MKSIYQAPSESSSNYEQQIFWSRVLVNQKASGIGMRSFCQQHQLNFSRFAYWKYKKQKIRDIHDNSEVLKKIIREEPSKFIPLQIAADLPATVEEYSEDEISDNEVIRTEIVFKNGHKLILPSTIKEINLLPIIKMIAEL